MTELLSTAIPYVNGAPHIGFAQELVIADAIARHHRARGRDVHFLSGTDENSLKNVLAAEAAGMPTTRFVDERAEEFRSLAALLNLDLDDFIRTSADPRHAPVVEALWRRCEAAGDIYRAAYEGLYCVGCEQFYKPQELEEDKCPEHRTSPETVRETNYFFRLSRYQEALIEMIDAGTLAIAPGFRKNEVRAFLEQPLADLSISRSRKRAHGWGIPVPDDPDQVIYVWFDALANYVSARGIDAWTRAEGVTHVIGKGVSRFHAVYWPAILLSAGWRLPDRILVHGYVTVGGEKISKSLGGAIEPAAPVARYGADALRYYLLRHVGSHRDGDFTPWRLAEVYEHELANQLGNLLSRTTALACKTPVADCESTLAASLAAQIDEAMADFAVHRAIEAIWEVVAATNAFASEREPWKLEGVARAQVLGELTATLRVIGDELGPFLPETAMKLLASLARPERVQLFPRKDAIMNR